MKAAACSRSSNALRRLTSRQDFLVESTTSMRRLEERAKEQRELRPETIAEPLLFSLSETLSRRFLQ